MLTRSWGAIGKLVSLPKVVCQFRDRHVPAIFFTSNRVIRLTRSRGDIGKLVSLPKVVYQLRDRQVPAILVTWNIVMLLLGPEGALGNLLRQKYGQQCTHSA